MKLLKIAVLVAIPVCLAFSYAPPLQRFLEILLSLEDKFASEKAYVHTDKPFYTSGETIWLKSYLVNATTHKKTTKSNVLHVELINPKDSIVFKTKLFIDQNTFGAAGDIEVDKDWESGNYQLRAFTNYMLASNDGFYFRKQLKIEKSSEVDKKLEFVNINKFPELTEIPFKDSSTENLNDIRINFYPEGGTFLAGVSNKIGVKALNSKNEGLLITGTIKKKGSDEIITLFRTFDFGLGNFAFTPEANVQYVAEINNERSKKIIELPATSVKTERLSIQNNQDHLILKVSTGFENLYGYYIIAHIRGHVFYSKEITNTTDASSLKLITKNFPRGISHFTLFDPNGNPKCERLVFLNAEIDKELAPRIITNKKEYNKRERVGYNIEIPGAENTPSNVSLSITQKSIVPLSINETIESWLLLNSDLRGEIPNAAVFFDLSRPKSQRDFLLESLMLTHGWRRFTWKDMHKNAYLKKEIEPEKGIVISGYAIAEDPENKGAKIETNLVFLRDDPFSEKQMTSTTRRFEYGPFVLKDSTETILQAKMIDVKERDQKKVAIILDIEKASPKVLPLSKYNLDKERVFFENYKKTQSHINSVNFSFNSVNQLNEVLISGNAKRAEERYDDIASDLGSYSFPTNRIIIDSIIGSSTTSVFDLIGRIAGVTVTGGAGDAKVSIRNSNSNSTPSGNDQAADPFLDGNPLFLLDGNQVDIVFIENLNGSDVSFIDVLKGNDTAIFGSRGVNGVIAIYLKKNTKVKYIGKSPGIINFLTNPFYKAKEFFSPDYFKNNSDPRPDYRTTLHWNPNIDITTKRTANNYFYTGDQTGKFQIEIQGITDEGQIIHTIEEFEVID